MATTADTYLRSFLKLWTQSDATSEKLLKKNMLTGLDVIGEKTSDLRSMFQTGRPVRRLTIDWMEEWTYPTAISATLATTNLTISGNLFNAAVTADSITQVIRAPQSGIGGTILQRDSDGVTARVTSVAGIDDGAPFVAVVEAYGGTVLSDDTGATTWRVIGEGWSDYSVAGPARTLTRTPYTIGSQTYAETFEIPRLRQLTDYENVPDEAAHNIAALIEKLRRQQNYGALRMLAKDSGGNPQWGNAVQDPTMRGLADWPRVLYATDANASLYVDNNGAELTKPVLDTLIRSMWLEGYCDFQVGDWWILCGPVVHGQIQDWDLEFRQTNADDKRVGFRVDVFRSKIGKDFKVKPLLEMRPGQLVVVNMKKAFIHPFAGDEMYRKEIPTEGRWSRWLISFTELGVVLRDSRASIGEIHNIDA